MNHPTTHVWTAAVQTESDDSLTAMEVIRAFNGRLTYRMLDHWVRTGIVWCQDPANGSGTRRRFTPSEVQAIGDIVEVRLEALETLREFSSGQLFARRLAYQQGRTRLQYSA